MKPKIYIAGKITGDPNYKAKFDAAAQMYKNRGYIVLNPACLPHSMLPADYMRICFAMIDTADTVAFLPGYEASPGAQLEYAYCLYTTRTFTTTRMKYAAVLRREINHDKVYVHYLVVQGCVDEDVLATIRERADTHETVMQILKARIKKIKEAAV